MGLSINETAPAFEADATQGKINFHDWIGDSWANVSKLYGMLPASTSGDAKSRTPQPS
jgi:alkyl hydroperoxide reductase subunit AhpC